MPPMQAQHFERLPARAPKFQRTRYPLSEHVLHALQQAGIQRLFSHQAQAIDLVTAGKQLLSGL